MQCPPDHGRGQFNSVGRHQRYRETFKLQARSGEFPVNLKCPSPTWHRPGPDCQPECVEDRAVRRSESESGHRPGPLRLRLPCSVATVTGLRMNEIRSLRCLRL